jgi:hypothetical protein
MSQEVHYRNFIYTLQTLYDASKDSDEENSVDIELAIVKVLNDRLTHSSTNVVRVPELRYLG